MVNKKELRFKDLWEIITSLIGEFSEGLSQNYECMKHWERRTDIKEHSDKYRYYQLFFWFRNEEEADSTMRNLQHSASGEIDRKHRVYEENLYYKCMFAQSGEDETDICNKFSNEIKKNSYQKMILMIKDKYSFIEFEFKKKCIKVVGLADKIDSFTDVHSKDELSLNSICARISSSLQITKEIKNTNIFQEFQRWPGKLLHDSLIRHEVQAIIPRINKTNLKVTPTQRDIIIPLLTRAIKFGIQVDTNNEYLSFDKNDPIQSILTAEVTKKKIYDGIVHKNSKYTWVEIDREDNEKVHPVDQNAFRKLEIMYLKSLFAVKDVLEKYNEEEKGIEEECAEVLKKTWKEMDADGEGSDPAGFKSISFKNKDGEEIQWKLDVDADYFAEQICKEKRGPIEWTVENEDDKKDTFIVKRYEKYKDSKLKQDPFKGKRKPILEFEYANPEEKEVEKEDVRELMKLSCDLNPDYSGDSGAPKLTLTSSPASDQIIKRVNKYLEGFYRPETNPKILKMFHENSWALECLNQSGIQFKRKKGLKTDSAWSQLVYGLTLLLKNFFSGKGNNEENEDCNSNDLIAVSQCSHDFPKYWRDKIDKWIHTESKNNDEDDDEHLGFPII